MLRGFIWFDKYKELFQSAALLEHGRVSLLYAVLTVGLELLLGLGIALLLRRSTLVQQRAVDRAPAAADDGAGDRGADVEADDQPGFRDPQLPAEPGRDHELPVGLGPSTALFTVVLVDIWVYTPFMMILLLAGLRSLPRQPFEAAELDGVPASFVFFRITLPMLMPYIITAACSGCSTASSSSTSSTP